MNIALKCQPNLGNACILGTIGPALHEIDEIDF